LDPLQKFCELII